MQHIAVGQVILVLRRVPRRERRLDGARNGTRDSTRYGAGAAGIDRRRGWQSAARGWIDAASRRRRGAGKIEWSTHLGRRRGGIGAAAERSRRSRRIRIAARIEGIAAP